MSETIKMVTTLMEGLFLWTNKHGVIMAMLAFLGIISVISAICSKAFQGIKYVFMIFIATPLIIGIGLINKNKRKQRIKELGEIRAFIKEKPSRLNRIILIVSVVLFFVFLIVLYQIFLADIVNGMIVLNKLTTELNLTYNVTGVTK